VAANTATVQAQALCTLVTTMRSFDIRVIACQVDTGQLADWWRDAGADSAVGALFGAPCPPQDFERLLGSTSGSQQTTGTRTN
jgi:EAL domain-containing protein (putative c-di-GMP-specific phosphodiesterase class I)